MSDKTSTLLLERIASNAIAVIVCDFPVPGGPSTEINFDSLSLQADNILRCSFAKGIGESNTNLSGMSVSSHSSSIFLSIDSGLLKSVPSRNFINPENILLFNLMLFRIAS